MDNKTLEDKAAADKAAIKPLFRYTAKVAKCLRRKVLQAGRNYQN